LVLWRRNIWKTKKKGYLCTPFGKRGSKFLIKTGLKKGKELKGFMGVGKKIDPGKKLQKDLVVKKKVDTFALPTKKRG